MNKDIYVVPFFGNWALKREGKSDPMSTHNRKDEAIRIGEELTIKLKSKLHILDSDIRNFEEFEENEEQ